MKILPPARRQIACAVLLLLGLSALQAQTIYRIVGPDGRLTFSDKPPAASVNSTARTAAGKPIGRSDDPANLPYELRQVVARFPVTLYTGNGCAPCAAGRQMLQSRGVPFTEYTVSSSDDVQALQRLSGAASLPLLTIGGQKIKGFAEAEWTQFLDAANYPTATRLPTTYRNPEPKQLVAVEKIAPPEEPAAPRDAPQAASNTSAPPPAPSNPAGIRF